MKLKLAASALTDLIFPPRCVLCGALVHSGNRICPGCAEKNPRVHAQKRIYLAGTGQTILCSVPYIYDGAVRQAIINFKFYGQVRAADFFGAQIAGEILNGAAFDFVTAVPISAQRRRLRGYNQSELIAQAAAKRLGLPYRECLVKTTDNKEQHKLSEKERRRNVQGVYALKTEISGKNILLLDDIVTTGATLCECAGVLFQGGANKVACAAIAEVEL